MAISKLTVNGVEIPSVKSVTYHETVNGGVDLRPGCVGSAYIEAEVYGTQADAVSPGAAVSYYIVDADSTETLIGVFNAEPVVKTKNTYKLVAYDNAYKLNVDFSGWLRDHQADFPMTRAALVAAACTVAGVVNATPNWTGSVQTVEAFYADGLTCRDILSYAAELSGYFVRCHADGQLYFEWYTSTPGTRIYPSSGEEQSETRYAYKQDGLQYANYTVPAIDGVAVHPSGEDDVAYIYPATPAGDNLLHIRNNILLTGATAAVYNAAAQRIYTQMTAVGAYVPATAQMFTSECPYKSGETVLVTDIQGVSFKTIVMSKTVTASGVTLESTGNEEQDAGYENTQKALVQLASDVVQINKLKVGWAEIDQAFIDYLTANDITAQNLTIVDENGNVLATYDANGITLGETDKAHAEMDFNSFELYDKDGNKFASLGDDRNAAGTAQIETIRKGDGQTTQFLLDPSAASTLSIVVKVNGVEVTTGIYKGLNLIRFDTAPADGDTISITYTTSYPMYHYDLGTRATGTSTGSYSVALGKDATANDTYTTVSGGSGNSAEAIGATVGGGESNSATDRDATVGGGRSNVASGAFSFVGGGESNTASGGESSIGGGRSNTASGISATVGGGYLNEAGGQTDTIGGGWGNVTGSNQYVTPQENTIGGGYLNEARGKWATVGGGYMNKATRNYATVSGGSNNTASSDGSAVGGGEYNTASGVNAFVVGDHNNANSGNGFVFGKYNQSYSGAFYAELVGNGTDENNRSNARKLDWNGNEWLAGRINADTGNFRNGATSSGNVDITDGFMQRRLPAVPTAGTGYWLARVTESNGSTNRGGVQFYRSTTNGDGMRLSAGRTVNGSTVSNRLALYVDSNGNRTVSVSDKAAWQEAIGTVYVAGDSVTFGTTSYTQFAGGMRGSGSWNFTIPLSKPVAAGVTASVSGSVIEFHGGAYHQMTNIHTDSNITLTVKVDGSGVTVHGVFATPPSWFSANTPCTFQAYGLTVSFS